MERDDWRNLGLVNLDEKTTKYNVHEDAGASKAEA